MYIYLSLSLYIYIYIYIYTHTSLSRRGDDTVGNPRRAQVSQFELFEFTLLAKVDKRFSVEQFEAAVSQSTVPSPPLKIALLGVSR